MLRRRVERIEKQKPERKIVYLWGDEPLPAGVDESVTTVIRFVWRDQTVKEKKRDKVVS